jgi:hypothetical protein
MTTAWRGQVVSRRRDITSGAHNDARLDAGSMADDQRQLCSGTHHGPGRAGDDVREPQGDSRRGLHTRARSKNANEIPDVENGGSETSAGELTRVADGKLRRAACEEARRQAAAVLASRGEAMESRRDGWMNASESDEDLGVGEVTGVGTQGRICVRGCLGCSPGRGPIGGPSGHVRIRLVLVHVQVYSVLPPAATTPTHLPSTPVADRRQPPSRRPRASRGLASRRLAPGGRSIAAAPRALPPGLLGSFA